MKLEFAGRKIPRPPDFGVYLVTDRSLSRGRPVEEIVAAAVRGGASAVQFREKDMSETDIIARARDLKKILEGRDVPLIINDRPDIALAAGADGVHLGQGDMPWAEARALLGPGAIIGLSVETMNQALAAESWDVAYIAASPVFATPTKTDTKAPWGLDGVRRLKLMTRHVVVAIGGINETNAASVLDAGADGLAVVSAICTATDPEAAARGLREIVDRRRREGR